MNKTDPELRFEGDREDRRLVEGRCGHCHAFVSFKDPDGPPSLGFTQKIDHDDGNVEFRHHYFIVGICTRPSCQQATILYSIEAEWGGSWEREITHRELIYPLDSQRPQLAPEIPENLRALFTEASVVELRSPNAAAFLGGRILEQVLRSRLGKRGSLAMLIDEFLETEHLPAQLHQLMHDVREFRNIAGHPGESDDGQWVNVDPDEAAYTLDIVSELLDYVYVRPKRQQEMRDRYAAKKQGKRVQPRSRGFPMVGEVPRANPKQPAPSPFDSDADDLPF